MLISIHEVFADLDPGQPILLLLPFHFNPRGLRRPRLLWDRATAYLRMISIHEVFADLDSSGKKLFSRENNFNPRGLRRPRRGAMLRWSRAGRISIHEVFADLDGRPRGGREPGISISIHEVFADLDQGLLDRLLAQIHFNPRGLRRPRHIPHHYYVD